MKFNTYEYDLLLKEKFNYSGIWNAVKKRLNIELDFSKTKRCTKFYMVYKGNKAKAIDLIKEFYENVPAKNLEYFFEIEDSVSPNELATAFVKCIYEYIKKMPNSNSLQKIQILYTRLYFFETVAAINFILSDEGQDNIYMSKSSIYDGFQVHENIPMVVVSFKNELKEILETINPTKEQHKKETIDKINIKLLQKKYPSIAQPLQFIVSKYL